MGAHHLDDHADLPIPEDVVPGPGWTEQMVEWANLIGPYKAMLIVETFGGQQVYVPADPALSRFKDLIGDDAAAKMSYMYKCCRLQIPLARFALRRARRAAIIAAARRRALPIAKAARMLRTSRSYLSELVNNSDEGTDAVPFTPTRSVDSRQLDMFPEE
ncbi:hypothetical protein HY78_00370 [Rhizorhabdus wittichii DC-6]|nr:hypothetical protein HY78_00370 [Rhizorhabdus wittichii DC-6]